MIMKKLEGIQKDIKALTDRISSGNISISTEEYEELLKDRELANKILDERGSEATGEEYFSDEIQEDIE